MFSLRALGALRLKGDQLVILITGANKLNE